MPYLAAPVRASPPPTKPHDFITDWTKTMSASARVLLTEKHRRMIMRAICLALADSLSAIRADSLTYPTHEWKELIDLLATKDEIKWLRLPKVPRNISATEK